MVITPSTMQITEMVVGTAENDTITSEGMITVATVTNFTVTRAMISSMFKGAENSTDLPLMQTAGSRVTMVTIQLLGETVDNIRGGTGHDQIDGGKGHDIIRGNDGDDTIDGEKETTNSEVEVGMTL